MTESEKADIKRNRVPSSVPTIIIASTLKLFSVVEPLLAGGDRDLQAILGQRQRASRVGGVSARRIGRTIEIEPKLARLRQAVAGQVGAQKPARTVGFGLAGGVAQNEEQVGVVQRLDRWLQAHGLPVNRELRRAGHHGLDFRSQYRRHLF